MKTFIATLTLIALFLACDTSPQRPEPQAPDAHNVGIAVYCASRPNCGLCASEGLCVFCLSSNTCIPFTEMTGCLDGKVAHIPEQCQ